MRIIVGFATVILLLGSVSRSTSALQASDNPSPLAVIQMFNAQIGWAVTTLCGPCAPHVVSGQVLRTTSGGTHWKDVTPLDSSGQRIDIPLFYAFDSRNAWATNISRGQTWEIFHTADGGRTWKGTAIPGAQAISFINPREGWLLAPLVGYTGHTDVDISRSTDGGETWIRVTSNTTLDSGLTNISGMTGITFLNSKTGWITGLSVFRYDWLYLYVTHDGGHTWREQTLPVPPQPQRNKPASQEVLHWHAYLGRLNFFTAQDGIIRADYNYYLPDGSDAGSVVVFCVTHDGGTTWTYTKPVPVRGIYQTPSQFVDINHGWVKEEDTLYVTGDGGRNWTTTRVSPLFADVTQLNFISPEVGWAVRDTGSGGGTRQTPPFLLRTHNGGRTWIPLLYTIIGQ